jgi:hypothetical protein
MKKDIEFPIVQGVSLAVIYDKNELNEDDWNIYLLNENDFELENILITSRGYSANDGLKKPEEIQSTSTLRHAIPKLLPQEYALVEMIMPSVFHLYNEFWVSYYVKNKIYDKKFIFTPNSISKENLMQIKLLKKEGVWHK